MDYQQFVALIKEKVASSIGNGMSLTIHTALKNNGRERIGITISDNQVNICPTIYLEEYFSHYKGGMEIDEIVDNILRLYHEVKFQRDWQIHTVKEFSLIRSKIVHKLIHAGMNQELLKNLPHVMFMDLAIVFYILYEVTDNNLATIPITNELVALWNTNTDELYRIALKNTPILLPATLKPMHQVIEELLGHSYEELSSEEDFMLVLSNQYRSFGASCILYNDILEQIAGQIGESYYIIPSSIHETIVIPESESPCRQHLLEMVKEINETQVEIEDVLSDNVYFYDVDERSLC